MGRSTRISKTLGVLGLLFALTLAKSTTGSANNPSIVQSAPSSSKTTPSDSKSSRLVEDGAHQVKKSKILSKAAKSKKLSKQTTVTPPKKPTFKTSQASASLRRIKKEYKDAVQMGIGYDWIKQRKLIQTTRSSKQSNNTTAVSHVVVEEQQIICLGPLATNLRHWHFSFRGCGIYEAGIYHGRLILPKDYPATPPRVQLWTPSGRFVPYADICLSASAYHPESWTPRWTVLSLVQALRLHMLTNPQEIGGMSSSTDETLKYAKRSLVWKLTWRAGKSFVTVDHARLLEQRVFVVESGVKEGVDSILKDSQPAAEGQRQEEEYGRESIGIPNEAHSEISLAEDDNQIETSYTPPPLNNQVDDVSHISSRMTKNSSSTSSTETTKRKKKPKMSTKTKKTGGLATMQRRTPQKIRKENLGPGHTVFLTLARVLTSPFHLAIISIVFLLWILNIP